MRKNKNNAIEHYRIQSVIENLEKEIEDTSFKIIKGVLLHILLESFNEDPEKAVEYWRKVKSI